MWMCMHECVWMCVCGWMCECVYVWLDGVWMDMCVDGDAKVKEAGLRSQRARSHPHGKAWSVYCRKRQRTCGLHDCLVV